MHLDFIPIIVATVLIFAVLRFTSWAACHAADGTGYPSRTRSQPAIAKLAQGWHRLFGTPWIGRYDQDPAGPIRTTKPTVG